MPCFDSIKIYVSLKALQTKHEHSTEHHPEHFDCSDLNETSWHQVAVVGNVIIMTVSAVTLNTRSQKNTGRAALKDPSMYSVLVFAK